MGCDIHAMIERKKIWDHGSIDWINAGDPDIPRDYELFAILAGVRNDINVTPISNDRGLPSNETYGFPTVCSEFAAYAERWEGDAHNHGWVTLTELRSFDLTQAVYDPHHVLERDEATGKITTTGYSSRQTYGAVGERRLFGVWGLKVWDDLMRELEMVAHRYDGDGESVRLVFFFDN